MKKIVIHSAGGYDKLKLEEHPDLKPAKGQVLVEVSHTGVNYADVCVRWGVYESAKKYVGWPITPGFEVAGKVGAVGEGVTTFKKGDRVMAVSFFAGYASQVVVPEYQVFRIPAHFTLPEAAGFLATGLTAYHALFQHFTLPAGAHVLVHSAAGGVGSALLQLSKIAGYRATAVVGSSHKIDHCRKLGAHAVIDKSKENLWARARESAPDGFDAVFDANGYTTLKDSYDHLRPVGKLVSYGSHSVLPKSGGPLARVTGGRLNLAKAAYGLLKTPRFNPMRLVQDNKSVIGFNLSFLFSRKDILEGAMNALLDWAETGKLPAPTVQEIPLAECARAHAAIESGKSVGKIVLAV